MKKNLEPGLSRIAFTFFMLSFFASSMTEFMQMNPYRVYSEASYGYFSVLTDHNIE